MRKYSFFFSSFLLTTTALFVEAKPKTPLPDQTLDGGVLSAETLGRGNTTASNVASPAAGSENPASLADSSVNATYTTVFVGDSSSLPANTVNESEPLNGKTLQYLSLQGEKGTIFYEPLARRNEETVTNPASPSTDYQELEYSANALGFAGADSFGREGRIGLSLAYVWSSLGLVEHRSGQADTFVSDTADGFRLNLGVRYPTGPVMWGMQIQNAPGFLWGKDFKREMLPVRVRVGNTWRALPGFLLFSLDWERRYYAEGSNDEDYVYLGTELFTSKYVVLRGGLFGTDVNKPEERHATAGFSILAKSGAKVSYAIDMYEVSDERIKRSFVSVQLPFQTSEEN